MRSLRMLPGLHAGPRSPVRGTCTGSTGTGRAPSTAQFRHRPGADRQGEAAVAPSALSAGHACASWRKTVVRCAALLLGGVGIAASAQQPPRWPPSLAELDALGRAIASEGCPRPLEVKSSFIRGARGADTTDEMRSIDCRGIRLAIYVARSGQEERESPMELVVERAHPRIDARLGVGADAEAVRSLLGAPSARSGEGFAYALRGRDSLAFEVRGGTVRAVTWSWDVD